MEHIARIYWTNKEPFNAHNINGYGSPISQDISNVFKSLFNYYKGQSNWPNNILMYHKDQSHVTKDNMGPVD